MSIDLDHIFKYHAPKGDLDVQSYTALREAGKAFAEAIVDLTPECADQTAAVRKVREAVMTANAAIALGGRLHKDGEPATCSHALAPGVRVDPQQLLDGLLSDNPDSVEAARIKRAIDEATL